MHGRGGACRRSSFTGRDSTAHPCHVALQLHAPLNCRGTLAVKGGTSAECDGVLRPVPRYGWRWGLRVGWGSSGSSSLARASTCLALRRLSSGLPRALVARVTPLVSAADGPLNGGRPDHDRFALRPPTVSPFQIDRSVLWASPLVAASCLVIRSFALSSGFPIWRNFHRGIRSSFTRCSQRRSGYVVVTNAAVWLRLLVAAVARAASRGAGRSRRSARPLPQIARRHLIAVSTALRAMRNALSSAEPCL